MNNLDLINFLRNIQRTSMIKLTTAATAATEMDSSVVGSTVRTFEQFYILDIQKDLDNKIYPHSGTIAIRINEGLVPYNITIGDLDSYQYRPVDNKLVTPNGTFEFFEYQQIQNLTEDRVDTVILKSEVTISKWKLHTEFMDALKRMDRRLNDGVTLDQCMEKIQEVYFEDPLGLNESWHMYFLTQINNGNFDDIIQGDE